MSATNRSVMRKLPTLTLIFLWITTATVLWGGSNETILELNTGPFCEGKPCYLKPNGSYFNNSPFRHEVYVYLDTCSNEKSEFAKPVELNHAYYDPNTKEDGELSQEDVFYLGCNVRFIFEHEDSANPGKMKVEKGSWFQPWWTQWRVMPSLRIPKSNEDVYLSAGECEALDLKACLDKNGVPDPADLPPAEVIPALPAAAMPQAPVVMPK